jgi:hypothetical protein
MNGTFTNGASQRWTLTDLPFAARLALAFFLVSVGLGYFSALVNLHFSEASPGNRLPTDDDIQISYRGKAKMCQLERLLLAHPSLPFNGQGSMRSAFTTRSGGVKKDQRNKAKALKLSWPLKDPRDVKKVEDAVRRDRDGERLALVAWIRAGTKKEQYEEDAFPLTGALTKQPITARFVQEKGNERFASIKSILDTRCARCHSESVGGAGAQFPLDSYEEIASYLHAEAGTGKSLPKLAMTTHVHLLGFAVLYGLTGLIVALTGLPGWLRVPLASLPLFVQVIDIAFWWLARLDEPYGALFARGIPITGAIVAAGLGLQILLTLFTLFGRAGKLLLVVLLVAAIGGGIGLKQKVIDPYLAGERQAGEVERE